MVRAKICAGRARENRKLADGRLAGKRAIVTGAASGIGRASALRFAEEGAAVLVADVAADGLAETREAVEKAGGRVLARVVDASDEAAVAGLVEACIAELGGLEVAYANAGITGANVPLLEATVDDWRRVLDVNLIGPFLVVKHAAPPMREAGGGSIVCTASVAGLRSGAGASAYSASKAGVVSLVQTAANQLAGTGVRVNAICPGLIETGMTRPIFDLARAAGKGHKIGQLNPLRRAGEPVEIANVALFLASDESSYVNGQAFAVDGGLSSSHPFVPGRLA
jgi:NAD(P)-dependent dehydrogenase (short-subunit alcohol dehydrogenase family)